MKDNYTYVIENKLYLNLTNRCSNACTFCIRNGREGMGSTGLWLKSEPTSADVIKLITDIKQYQEAVFCGFGEPLYRLQEVIEIGQYIKSQGVPVRINTNGQANLIHGYDVVPKLVDSLDIVSISLNAPTAEKYQAVCNSEFGDEGFYAMLDFANHSVTAGFRTILTVVDTIPKEDIEACEKLVKEQVKGAEFRVRNYY